MDIKRTENIKATGPIDVVFVEAKASKRKCLVSDVWDHIDDGVESSDLEKILAAYKTI